MESNSAALCIEEHNFDNNPCRAQWLVWERLFTCVCTLKRTPDSSY